MSENFSRALKRRQILESSSDEDEEPQYRMMPHYEILDPVISWSDYGLEPRFSLDLGLEPMFSWSDPEPSEEEEIIQVSDDSDENSEEYDPHDRATDPYEG